MAMPVLVSADDPRGPAAVQIVLAGEYRRRLDGAFYMPSSKGGRAYRTTADTCTCRDYEYRSVRCKHMLAVRLQLELDQEEYAF
jgi:hypothetical protein